MRTRALLVGFSLVLVAGCGRSDGNVATNRDSERSLDSAPPSRVVDLPAGLSNAVDVAVSESRQVLIASPEEERELRSVSIVEVDGSLSRVDDLPALRRASALGTADGFVLVGYVCAGAMQSSSRCPMGAAAEQIDDVTLVAVFIDDGGTVGPVIRGPAGRSDLVGLPTARPHGALVSVDHRHYEVDVSGFHQIEVPDQTAAICGLGDGSIVAQLVEEDPDRPDDEPATVSFRRLDGGAWQDEGEPFTVTNAAGDVATASCVPGGMVFPQGIASSATGLMLGDRDGESTGPSLDGREPDQAIGLAPSGVVVRENRYAATVELVNWSVGTVDAKRAFRGVVGAGCSWDGRVLAVLHDSVLTIAEVEL